MTTKDFNSIDNLAYNTIQSGLIQSKDKQAAAESANNLEVEKHTKVLEEFQATVVNRHRLEKAKSEYNRLKEDICRAHRDGGSSQGGTRHSLPPARRRGGFNLDD